MEKKERITERLHEGFRFKKLDWEDTTDLSAPTLNDSEWEAVTVPHDWAIGHDFEEDHDPSYSEVLADGILRPAKHTGRTGALPHVGCGWYRIPLDIPEESQGKRLELIFDGIMWESEIYLNGQRVGGNHFGYRSFSVDITSFARCGERNLLAIRAVVKPNCSRWYPGAGIFRNVYLVTRAEDSLAYCGIRTWIRDVSEEEATLMVNLFTDGCADSFEIELCAPEGGNVLSGRGLLVGKTGVYTAKVEMPELWSPDTPNLYTLRVKLFRQGKKTDSDQIRIGFRNCQFDANEGFSINGKSMKFQGVCLHHDLGVFGAAINYSALRRQLSIMQEMGVNAVRTSHNPPAPELLDLCDEMGILVIDEFYDEWRSPKVANGYAQYFDEHAEQDTAAIIHRDINHPSIIMWSIGNEMVELKDPDGWKLAKMLSDICHQEDPTRPTTAGMNNPLGAEANGFFDNLDIIGLNYCPHRYKVFHEKYPDKIFYGSETASCISTRGEYRLPAVVEMPTKPNSDLTVSDYALSSTGWSYHPDREFVAQEDNPSNLGEFVWTGFDYLGEPTPYYSQWPVRSSYFGIVDTAGIPKSRFYQYKSQWTDKKVLFVMPHWNFEGREGEKIPVHIFTNYDRVELFVNGQSMGVKEKSREVRDYGVNRIIEGNPDIARCRIVYEDVIYTPGELVAVALGENGEVLARTRVKTAGEPYTIKLVPERKTVTADGEDACFVRAYVVDRYGYVCPTASNLIRFKVEGAGELYATDNGDPRETDGYFRPDKKALNGVCVAVIKTVKGQTGTIGLRADSEGLVSSAATLFAQNEG